MSKYKWKDIAWRDLLLVPIVIVATFVFGILAAIISFVFFNVSEAALLSDSNALVAQVIATVVAYLIVILSFYLLHYKTMGQRFMKGLQGIRQYIFWIVGHTSLHKPLQPSMVIYNSCCPNDFNMIRRKTRC